MKKIAKNFSFVICTIVLSACILNQCTYEVQAMAKRQEMDLSRDGPPPAKVDAWRYGTTKYSPETLLPIPALAAKVLKQETPEDQSLNVMIRHASDQVYFYLRGDLCDPLLKVSIYRNLPDVLFAIVKRARKIQDPSVIAFLREKGALNHKGEYTIWDRKTRKKSYASFSSGGFDPADIFTGQLKYWDLPLLRSRVHLVETKTTEDLIRIIEDICSPEFARTLLETHPLLALIEILGRVLNRIEEQTLFNEIVISIYRERHPDGRETPVLEGQNAELNLQAIRILESRQELFLWPILNIKEREDKLRGILQIVAKKFRSPC